MLKMIIGDGNDGEDDDNDLLFVKRKNAPHILIYYPIYSIIVLCISYYYLLSVVRNIVWRS